MKSKNIIFCLFLLLGIVTQSRAQFTLTTGNNSLEISGLISTFYNHRVLKDNIFDKSKNRFKLRDAQIQLEGRYKDVLEYELQVDFADLAAGSAGNFDPENPGIMDAFIVCKAIPWFDVKLGYTKVPYGRSSLVPFVYSPYWQRAELGRGTIFSRRDAGVSLEKDFFQQKFFVFAGVYTGTGEMVIKGENDPSGKPEYIGRAEFHYPARYRYRDIDFTHSPVPMVSLGVNARYSNRTLPDNSYFLSGQTSEFGIKAVDGKRYAGGFDVSAQWKGFSVQAEAHRIYSMVADTNNGNLLGLPESVTNNQFRTGSYYLQANYYSRILRSVFSIRFEELNLNDLAPGIQQNISAAYNYVLKGSRATFKIQYWHILAEETSIDPLKWKGQVRIGMQFRF